MPVRETREDETVPMATRLLPIAEATLVFIATAIGALLAIHTALGGVA